MKNFILMLIFLIITCNCFAKGTKGDHSVNCSNIDQYLPDCLRVECKTISKDGMEVKQKILGLNKSGGCIHEQYFKDKTIKCQYSEESRKFLALQIKNSKFIPNRKINEAIKNKMVKEYEPDLIEKIFINECKITKKI